MDQFDINLTQNNSSSIYHMLVYVFDCLWLEWKPVATFSSWTNASVVGKGPKTDHALFFLR